MYQPWMICTLHDERWAVFLCNNTEHPNVTNGWQLQYCDLLSLAYTDIFVTTFYCHNILMFVSTFGRNSSHNFQKNESGKPLSIPTKVSLSFSTSLSSKSRRCVCGGTSSYTIPLFSINSLYLTEASLSKKLSREDAFCVKTVNEPLV